MDYDEGVKTRRWPLWVLLALLAFGSFAAILMTRHHEQHLAGESEVDLLGCSESSTVSCDSVNTSAWSEVLGIPTATWGLATYLLLAVLAVRGLRGSRGSVAVIFAIGCATSLFSIWLFYVAEVEVGFLCAWCLRMYAVNLATPVLAWLAVRPQRPARAEVIRAALTFAVIAVVAIGWQRLYRRSFSPAAPPPATVAGAPVFVPPEPVPLERDPDGPAPARSIAGKTEDGAPTTLTIAPGDAWKGSSSAKVTVVEFGDFQCGYCRRASGELARVHAAYADRALFVWKHYPLDPACNPGAKTMKHEYACMAAKAAVCAHRQGKFWPLHDALFANQKVLASQDAFRRTVADTGVDLAALDTCVAEADAQLRADGEAGRAMGLHGTPRIFVNGTLQKPNAIAIARAIERALGTDEQLADQRARAFQPR